MKCRLLASIVSVALIPLCAPALAQEDYVLVKTFAIEAPYTINPRPSPLVRGRDGNFYGENGYGVFRVTPDGSFSSLGQVLVPATAIDGSDGYFYTVTNPPSGRSIVKFTEDGTQTTLYQFSNASQGALLTPLAQGSDGQLYGSVYIADGTLSARLFRLTTGGVFTSLHEFTNAEAAHTTRLIAAGDGNMYGTTARGLNGFGRLYRLTPAGAVTTVHTFTGGLGGALPSPFLLDASDGSLYGTTEQGGTSGAGIVFRLVPGGGFTVVYNFPGFAVNGVDKLVTPFIQGSDGNLYGTTQYTIFKLTPGGVFTLLHSNAIASPGWAAADRYGSFFGGVLEGTNGDLYGTASDGGPDGYGVVFRLNRQRVACFNDITPLWRDYNGGTLWLVGAVKAETPAVYATWMTSAAGTTQLWAAITPAIDPTLAFEVSGALPPSGTVGIHSLLITSTFQVCTSSRTVETGSGAGGAATLGLTRLRRVTGGVK